MGKQRVLLLDRDGVINVERGEYTYRKEDVEFVPGLIETLKLVAELKIPIIIITNQGGIAKGIYSKEQVEELHQWMRDEMSAEGIKIEAIYYCPHHDQISRCLCRKPGSLLFEKAIALHNIDTGSSLMIGDSERDIIAAGEVGIMGVKVKANFPIGGIVKDWI